MLGELLGTTSVETGMTSISASYRSSTSTTNCTNSSPSSRIRSHFQRPRTLATGTSSFLIRGTTTHTIDIESSLRLTLSLLHIKWLLLLVSGNAYTSCSLRIAPLWGFRPPQGFGCLRSFQSLGRAAPVGLSGLFALASDFNTPSLATARVECSRRP
uniref:Uncharacterized protein n=1 Tax=Mycena chlorophos TaxID=658473 RepID=A0ABQ0M2P8_MYCCL|nr:predicted protein [Mycena chlorophos]